MLLILVHVSGDIRIQQNEVSTLILDQAFPGGFTDKTRVTPCFIRGQLGPVFKHLAHKLMREVLTQLEILSPSRQCKDFPMILTAFSVLFMAVESLQYHIAKESFHSHYNGRTVSTDISKERNLDEWKGQNILLQFYRSTFQGCHNDLHLKASSATSPELNRFFDLFNRAIEDAKPYLQKKSRVTKAHASDMSAFFDRLLAKMYLPE
jgi:hypothetical protein